MKPTSSLHFCYAKDKKEKKKRIEKTQLNMDNLILYEIIQNMSFRQDFLQSSQASEMYVPIAS